MEKFLEDAVKLSRNEDLLESYYKVEADIELAADEANERGLKQGVSQTRREVAETMLQNGYNISEVIKISKLSEKEILEIKKDLKI